jgi:hypothetical protein
MTSGAYNAEPGGRGRGRLALGPAVEAGGEHGGGVRLAVQQLDPAAVQDARVRGHEVC